MLALLVLVAVVLLPFILLFITPQQRPAQVAEQCTTKDDKNFKLNSLSDCAAALKQRLCITRTMPNITLSVHKDLHDDDYKELVNTVAALSEIGEVQVLIRVANDTEQSTVQQRLSQQSPYLKSHPHRILCCESHIGKIAFLRQLRPQLHIEFESQVLDEIRPHVPVLVLHSVGSAPQPAPRTPVANRIGRDIGELLTLNAQL